jgi:hypothetical protein
VFLWSGTKTKNCKRKKEITIHTKKGWNKWGGKNLVFSLWLGSSKLSPQQHNRRVRSGVLLAW